MEYMTKDELIELLEQLVIDEKTGIVYKRDDEGIFVPVTNISINNQDDKPKDDNFGPLNQYINELSVDDVHHRGTTLCYERYLDWCENRSLTPTAIKTFVPMIMEKMGMVKKQSQMIVYRQLDDGSLYQKPDNSGYVAGECKPVGEKARFTYFEKEGG